MGSKLSYLEDIEAWEIKLLSITHFSKEGALLDFVSTFDDGNERYLSCKEKISVLREIIEDDNYFYEHKKWILKMLICILEKYNIDTVDGIEYLYMTYYHIDLYRKAKSPSICLEDIVYNCLNEIIFKTEKYMYKNHILTEDKYHDLSKMKSALRRENIIYVNLYILQYMLNMMFIECL